MTEITDSRLATRANDGVVIIFHLPNCRLSVAVKANFPVNRGEHQTDVGGDGNIYYPRQLLLFLMSGVPEAADAASRESRGSGPFVFVPFRLCHTVDAFFLR